MNMIFLFFFDDLFSYVYLFVNFVIVFTKMLLYCIGRKCFVKSTPLTPLYQLFSNFAYVSAWSEDVHMFF